MKNGRYRKILQKLSPLWILGILAMAWACYILIRGFVQENSGWGWAYLGMLALAGTGIAFLVVDWILKEVVKS